MATLTVTPHEYQEEGIKWMLDKELSNKKGGILADEVGLGKTIQSIGLICNNKLPATLILVPKSLLNQWCDEFKKFARGVTIYLCEDKEVPVLDPKKISVVIAPISQIYARTSKNSTLATIQYGYKKTPYHSIKWDRVIVDEAHSIKNRKSKLHKACVDLDSKFKWLLTATPIMNRMTDFVNLMGFYGYTQIECQTSKIEIAKNMIMRRTKEQVKHNDARLELPSLNTTICEVDFQTDEERNLYCEVFNKMKAEIKELKRDRDNNNVMEALERLLRIRQISIHPQLYYDGIAKKNKHEPEQYTGTCTKLETLVDLLKEKPSDEKAIIFCQFIKEMKIYEKRLESEGYNTLMINGSLSLEERTSRIEEFKTDKTKTVILIQINTGGCGLNLQEANWVYITAPTWNPCMEYQAIGRAHRSGQKKEVNVKKIVLNGEETQEFSYVEASIVALQEEKQKIVREILADETLDEGVKSVRVQKTATKLTMNQISKLIR